MTNCQYGQFAILYPGDHETRQNATSTNNRLAQVFQALAKLRVSAQPKEDYPGIRLGVPPYVAQHAMYRAIFLNQPKSVIRLIELGADPGAENASL